MLPIATLGPESLLTNRGPAIGLGRVKIPRMPEYGFDFEIPLLSFLVIKNTEDNEYIATCIHIQTDGYGKTEEDAINDMICNVCHFLQENFKHEEHQQIAWDNLFDLFKSSPTTNPLWDAYHALQLELAKKGVSTDWYSGLMERIKELEEEVHRLKMGEMTIEYKYKKAA
jgi:hypothetical protein